MLEQGMLVDGKYRILSQIGKGGMSVVYLAIVESANMTWAVKEVRKDSKTDYNIIQQGLIAEIDTLKSVRHEKLPRIIDVLEHEDSYIIIMDYIEGLSMDKILEKKGAQAEEDVVKWSKQLCEVLGYLHSRPTPIIYRDMKPSNIMLKPNGDVTIIDFGTAKKYEFDSGETTGLGTAGYAAPEQYGGLGRTDARTDIFALGMTMYTLLTGIDPEKTLVVDNSIRSVNPAFSLGLDEIILKCTQRDANKRYQSCAELFYALEDYKNNDKKARLRKKIKIASFVGALSLSIVCAVTSLLINVQAKSVATDKYEEIMQNASTEIDYDRKIQLYEEAINVPDKGGKKEAYLELIKAYRNNDKDETIFTDEEATQLQKLIMTNRDALEQDLDGYVEICYETGKLFWYYYYDTNQVTRAKYAVDWFQIVTNRTDTSYEYYGLSLVYQNIGAFYRDYTTRLNEADDAGMYTELFTNMENLVNTVGTEKTEGNIVRLELLGMVENALHQYAPQFQRDGVSKEKMMALYEKIKLLLNDISVANDKEDKLYIKKKSILDEMKATKESITLAYGEEQNRKEG